MIFINIWTNDTYMKNTWQLVVFNLQSASFSGHKMLLSFNSSAGGLTITPKTLKGYITQT